MALLIASCVLGIFFGVILQRLFGHSSNESEVQVENDSLRVELDSLRSQVDGHFATSAMMFQNLTEEYRKLLEHMASSAQSLEVELPEQMLADFSTVSTLAQLPEEPAEEQVNEMNKLADENSDEQSSDDASGETVDDATQTDSATEQDPPKTDR
ncbi:MAG: hypothetical protein DRQ54_07620 [Gammaproteobacteria bacterium]|nr:MAG: hypothetical protein DRQ54_07620 [Gammaproteobacteria bacterium]RLA12425.1 MAG: hypothetical protein DRQ52_08030 [Gammaproteobacteria bacterium]